MAVVVKKNVLKKAMLCFLLALLPTSLVGCKDDEQTQPNIIETLEKEGYYNLYPIQVHIDPNFSQHNKNLIITSFQELDEVLTGLRFEYVDGLSHQHSTMYSYINVAYDSAGTATIQSYQDPRTMDVKLPFAHNVVGSYASNSSLPPDVVNFRAYMTLGGYFAISEDIPNSNLLMGLEVKWNNYERFGAYVDTKVFTDNRYWDFYTTYADFRKNIENSFKGVVKHEAGHALGYRGDEMCDAGYKCHSSDKDSLMYAYTSYGTATFQNKVTQDFIDQMNQKYPPAKSGPTK